MNPVLSIEDGVGDFLRTSGADHRPHTGSLRPDQHFMIAWDHRIRFMSQVWSLWVISDRDAHLRLPGAFPQLTTLVIEPVLAFTGDQAGIVNEVTIKTIRLVAVAQRGIRGQTLPRSIG